MIRRPTAGFWSEYVWSRSREARAVVRAWGRIIWGPLWTKTQTWPKTKKITLRVITILLDGPTHSNIVGNGKYVEWLKDDYFQTITIQGDEFTVHFSLLMTTADPFKLVPLGTPLRRHLLVATETEACTVSKRAVCVLLEYFLAFRNILENNIYNKGVKKPSFVNMYFKVYLYIIFLCIYYYVLNIFNTFVRCNLRTECKKPEMLFSKKNYQIKISFSHRNQPRHMQRDFPRDTHIIYVWGYSNSIPSQLSLHQVRIQHFFSALTMSVKYVSVLW